MSETQFTFQSVLPVSRHDAFAWHLRPGALERLVPPWVNVSFKYPLARPNEEGGKVVMQIKWGPFSLNWVLEHRQFIPNQEFSDIQVQGPFRHYTHRHHFTSLDAHSCQLSDEITYELPLLNRRIEKEFTRLFSWRQVILRDDLQMQARYPSVPLRILLSGSSGFIGSKLMSFLRLLGHDVVRLVRRKEELKEDAIFWDPNHGQFQKEAFEGFDAVIHLAGANIAEGRWTKQRKEQLFLSRCRDTWLLSQVLCRLYQPPKTVITASAIGFYGDRGDEELTEESAQGKGFLADLCDKWEKATDAIENRGARVVHPRFGAVLSAQGGMLKKMLPLFHLGLGGKLGSGRQKISWIGIDDLLGGIYHILMIEELSGPVNLVAPNPVSQAEFTKMLAKQLHRPAFFHLPASLLKVAFGEMGEEVFLSSARVIPEKLIQTGYVFRYPNLQTALDYVI